MPGNSWTFKSYTSDPPKFLQRLRETINTRLKTTAQLEDDFLELKAFLFNYIHDKNHDQNFHKIDLMEINPSIINTMYAYLN